MNREFDAASTKLENGFTVIEASAGTGKTTAISAIVLRLLLERPLSIEQILIATYTELATAELRGRVRDIIADALRVLRGGAPSLPFVATILENVPEPRDAVRRLEAALQNFDQAAIFTIHGFCARVLADRAFESGAPFEMELTSDQSRLLHEVADDFWRSNFYRKEPLLAAVLRDRLTPEKLAKLLHELTNNPAMRVVPEPEESAALQQRLEEIWRRAGDCDELNEVAGRLVISLQVKFCAWARDELRRRKNDTRVQSFDDLLTRLDAALRGTGGARLRQSLRERFAVALIDEFQDTDPVQYSILSQIYETGNAPVFFIADPKQAIYGFRGADVFTYLAAARVAQRRYTLGVNWRSEPRLVEGVSAWFRQREDAFVIPGIDLATVRGAAETEKFSTDDESDSTLRVWIASNDEPRDVSGAVAGEIARLLMGGARMGARTLTPRDFAILVNNNSQPASLQRALARHGIPAVVYSAANVFKSREASELLRVLLAVAQPTRESMMRAALATELLGLRASELEALSSDEAQWEERLNRFADYHSLWRDHGFVEAMRSLLVRERVRGRLLALRDGERRLTNMLHLIELLHIACAENRFGIDGLISWLRQQGRAREAREDYELRLESDEDAVRIVTIHKSKGLEYGITFYPHARREPRQTESFLKFHSGDELVLDLEKSPASKTLREREELGESVRQLYVALTRAKHRSYVVWRESKKKSKSAPAWLFSREQSPEAFLGRGGSNVSAEMSSAFSKRAEIVLEPLPEEARKVFAPPKAGKIALAPRAFTGAIDRSWGLTSFSSLVRGSPREAETPDYDSVETSLETEPLAPAEGIHAFPGGMRAGTCVHKILEDLDFQNPAQLPSLVSEKLAQFRIGGFDDVLVETMARMLEIPLGQDRFTLSQISKRLSELEFTFPINDLTVTRLQRLFGKADFAANIGRLQFDAISGFLKGFVDLVFEHDGRFYFLDWKSNWLGADASFYRRENLAAVMVENFYTLQLNIYALALHRFLARRLPGYDYEKNFGGAFYMFLRGVDNERRGVFDWRPPFAFIRKLDRVFHGNGKT
jgi:exodeoxyribonuclease V beta subunit